DPAAARALRDAADGPTRVVTASAVEIRGVLDELHAPSYVEHSTTALLRRSPEESAHTTLSRGQRVTFGAIALLLAGGAVVSWETTCIALIVASIGFYCASTFFKFALVYRTMHTAEPEVPISEAELAMLDESSLPVYTILVPLFQEASVVGHLVEGLLE